MTDFDGEILEWIQVAKGDKCPLCKGTGKIRDGHMTCPKCGGKKVAKDANESLATIMRHDKGHDDWHASHGDPPCKDEADCERMSAKYAEVKAEQGVTKGGPGSGAQAGHQFEGNQYMGGHAYNGRTGADKGAISTIPQNVGHRDFDANTTLGQIGRMNVLAVSGGRVHTLFADDKRGGGKAIGLELPVGHGYKVRTFLADNDSYTVQRVFSRAGKDTVKGEETDVFAPEVGEAVYRAGMYVNVPFGGHNP